MKRDDDDMIFCKTYDMIIVRCSVCNCYLTIKDAKGRPGVSHSFCDRYLIEYKRQNGLED